MGGGGVWIVIDVCDKICGGGRGEIQKKIVCLILEQGARVPGLLKLFGAFFY